MSTDSFVAIDVETANADLASICQIGLVTFADGQIVSGWQSLIDPEDEFNEINISIHGIDESSVQGAPRFNDLAVHIGKTLEGQFVASHTSFDCCVATFKKRQQIQFINNCSNWLHETELGRSNPSLSCCFFKVATHLLTVLSIPEDPERGRCSEERSCISRCGA